MRCKLLHHGFPISTQISEAFIPTKNEELLSKETELLVQEVLRYHWVSLAWYLTFSFQHSPTIFESKVCQPVRVCILSLQSAFSLKRKALWECIVQTNTLCYSIHTVLIHSVCVFNNNHSFMYICTKKILLFLKQGMVTRNKKEEREAEKGKTWPIAILIM